MVYLHALYSNKWEGDCLTYVGKEGKRSEVARLDGQQRLT